MVNRCRIDHNKYGSVPFFASPKWCLSSFSHLSTGPPARPAPAPCEPACAGTPLRRNKRGRTRGSPHGPAVDATSLRTKPSVRAHSLAVANGMPAARDRNSVRRPRQAYMLRSGQPAKSQEKPGFHGKVQSGQPAKSQEKPGFHGKVQSGQPAKSSQYLMGRSSLLVISFTLPSQNRMCEPPKWVLSISLGG